MKCRVIPILVLTGDATARIIRLESTRRRLRSFLDGEVSRLEELEAERLPYFGGDMDKRENRWSRIVSGSDLIDTI